MHIRHYNIGYAIVSLIFVTNAAGFILAAFFVDALRAKFGRGKILAWLRLEDYIHYMLTSISSQNPHLCSDDIDLRVYCNSLHPAISGCRDGVLLTRLRHGYKPGLKQCFRRQPPE
jgi:hypothetical protein